MEAERAWQLRGRNHWNGGWTAAALVVVGAAGAHGAGGASDGAVGGCQDGTLACHLLATGHC